MKKLIQTSIVSVFNLKINFLEHSSFKKIYLSNRKIIFLEKSNLIFVGIFDSKSVGGWIKLYLLHVHTAFLNFVGDNLKNLTNNNFEEENLTDNEGAGVPLTKEILQVKIFEVIFLFLIINP